MSWRYGEFKPLGIGTEKKPVTTHNSEPTPRTDKLRQADKEASGPTEIAKVLNWMKLTVEQIEQWREALSRTYGQSAAPEMIEALKDVNALCDAALRAGEMKAMRDAAFQVAAMDRKERDAMREELGHITHARDNALIGQMRFVTKIQDMREAIQRTLTNGFPLSASTRADLENALSQSLNPKNEEKP